MQPVQDFLMISFPYYALCVTYSGSVKFMPLSPKTTPLPIIMSLFKVEIEKAFGV